LLYYCLNPLLKSSFLCIFILTGTPEKEIEELRKHERTGRPLRNEGFVKKLERTLNRILHIQKPGRKKGNEYGVPGIDGDRKGKRQWSTLLVRDID
jgi:hypothetical protein